VDLARNEEQRQFADSVGGFLRRHYDSAARSAAFASPPGESILWRRLSEELQLTGLMVSAEEGGQGASPADAMVVMEELGRRLVLDPFAEFCVIAPFLLRRVHSPTARNLLRGIARGETRIALCLPEAGYGARNDALTLTRIAQGVRIDGAALLIPGGPVATHYLLGAGAGAAVDTLFLVGQDATGIRRVDYRMVDGRPGSDLHFEGVIVPVEATIEIRDLVALARDVGIAAACAEAMGVMREMLAITIDYTSQRRQFGAPLSSFQAIQHRIADMACEIEKAEAMTALANLLLEAEGAVRERSAAAAKVVVSEASRFVGQSAIQLHGAMGTAHETPISRYFRRATTIDLQFGSAAWNLERYAAAFAQDPDCD
jgi:alkylation response protein AidB-like acyl-CoA dehydrogenase